MSFMSEYDVSNQLEELKPNPKLVGKLDILSKAKADLNYLENGKIFIEKYMSKSGIDDEQANKKLKKLNDSIKKLKALIDKYESDNGDI